MDTAIELARPSASQQAVASIQDFFSAMRRNRAGFIGFLALSAIILIALIGPFLVPQTLPTDVHAIYQPPSSRHLLGTDSEGRDVLIQVIAGGQSIILVGFMAAAISTLISITFGALAAYVGGFVDSVVMMLSDIVLTIPQIALLALPTLLRAVRAQVLSLKEREYIEAARLLDLGTPRIVFYEILPTMASFILMNFTIAMTDSIYAQVGLYLLGLAPLAGHNWGIMLNFAWWRGAIFFKNSLLYILAPVTAIALLQLALVMTTRSLEDIFNPRLREG